MSLVAEVLQSAAAVDGDEIKKKVPELKGYLETFKKDLMAAVENIYVKYSHRYQTYSTLFNKGTELHDKLVSLKEKATYVSNNRLTQADKDLHVNIKELFHIDFKLKVMLKWQNILKLLDVFKTELQLHNYMKCVQLLKELSSAIKDISPEEHLELYDELRKVIDDHDLELHDKLRNIFAANIEIIKLPKQPFVTIKIKKHNEEMELVMLTYYLDDHSVLPLNLLARDLLEYIFTPLVNQEVVLTETKDNNFVYLRVEVKNAKAKCDYQTVFNNLQQTLEFLKIHFNYKLSDNLGALEHIAHDLRDELSELIIKDCLTDTIPSSSEELQNYKGVIEATKKLELYLIDSKVFDASTTSILEYASNVDVLFINKKCEKYLETATEIMKKDLHDIVQVGVPHNSERSLGEQFQFPQCSISKNVQELLQLCEDIFEERLGASPENRDRLFTTVVHILAKYLTFVPEYHSKYLTALPQQIAVFFNNCEYISNQLQPLYVKYCSKLKPVSDFTTEGVQFRKVGVEMFSKYIGEQVQQINEIMEEAQLIGPIIEKVHPKTEKCIRQCLRQQELLKTVWFKVLPYEVYNNNMGVLVNALCSNIITAIVKFEDIPAQVAEDLVYVIKLVLTRAPKLFIDPTEVTLYVPLWYKLNELNFVLSANLTDINDRWADGKGPLAMQFKPDELKRLIKALFQNTDKRAAVLAKIF